MLLIQLKPRVLTVLVVVITTLCTITRRILYSKALPSSFTASDSSSEEFAPVTFDPEFLQQLVGDSQTEADRCECVCFTTGGL